MNAVEIEEAITSLFNKSFNSSEFPFEFLTAFGNKATTIKKLRSGSSNNSDVNGGVLQRNNIHLATCDKGEVNKKLEKLRFSSFTNSAKAKFILATDGFSIEAEDLNSGEIVICDYSDFPNHFGFFLPLAGITTTKQIRENTFDIRATSRLNKLYLELIKENRDWDNEQKRKEMNHFMARLIFCFFAEDTDIFGVSSPFTKTVEEMSESNSSNTHEIIKKIFLSMNTPIHLRANLDLPRWASKFPYVNGGLFTGDLNIPKFSKLARSYLSNIGNLDWTKINPDIFGSMIQSVSEENERGQLGMHYTSVPNILKVLNPLFLDDIKEKLEEAKSNPRKLINLRNRISKIRIFDPACGSGNFLVIAYKELRKIENEINDRRKEYGRKSDIPLTNFRGIELRQFSAEIARLALIIAVYQCDVLYLGQKEALAEFLPLESNNWITCGNALKLDWRKLCPNSGKGVKIYSDDLLGTPINQSEVNFENDGGETYICGNPPYLGSTYQSKIQKSELASIFSSKINNWKTLDYVSGWFMKAAEYGRNTNCRSAFVTTNSICQGQQVPILWPLIYSEGQKICFAYRSFKWGNLASHNAAVTVSIICISDNNNSRKRLYSFDNEEQLLIKETSNINAYLVPSPDIFVEKSSEVLYDKSRMTYGNKPVDGGNLLLDTPDLPSENICPSKYIRPIAGSHDFINGTHRYCLWIKNSDLNDIKQIPFISERVEANKINRLKSKDSGARKLAERPHQFRDLFESHEQSFIIPRVSSENRPYLPIGILPKSYIINDGAFAMYDAPLWNFSLIASRIHLVWIATVCGQLETSYRYSNTLGWNTFPINKLTEQNKKDLIKCAEEILLARETHYPLTIADLYDPVKMPKNLKHAHENNDEVVERIYIGRKFNNDSERIEKLFELYLNSSQT